MPIQCTFHEILPTNLQDTEPTSAPLLAVTEKSYEKLEGMDDKIIANNAFLVEAKSNQQAAYEDTLTAVKGVEEGQMNTKSLAEQEMVIKEQLKSKERELYYHQQLQRQVRENAELKVVVESKQKEIEQLQSNLLKTKGELESAQEELKKSRGQLWQASMELEANHSRVQELERERAELQAEMNKERREVEHTLTQKAAALPTPEPAHEMEVWLMHFTQHCSLADYIPPSVSSTSTTRQWGCCSQKALGMR